MDTHYHLHKEADSDTPYVWTRMNNVKKDLVDSDVGGSLH